MAALACLGPDTAPGLSRGFALRCDECRVLQGRLQAARALSEHTKSEAKAARRNYEGARGTVAPLKLAPVRVEQQIPALAPLPLLRREGHHVDQPCAHGPVGAESACGFDSCR